MCVLHFLVIRQASPEEAFFAAFSVHLQSHLSNRFRCHRFAGAANECNPYDELWDDRRFIRAAQRLRSVEPAVTEKTKQRTAQLSSPTSLRQQGSLGDSPSFSCDILEIGCATRDGGCERRKSPAIDRLLFARSLKQESRERTFGRIH